MAKRTVPLNTPSQKQKQYAKIARIVNIDKARSFGNMPNMKHRDLNCSKVCAHCSELFFRDKRCTWAHWDKARFCSRDCAGAGIAKELAPYRLSFEDSFNAKIHKGDANACWPWTAARDRDGYGLFSFGGKHYRAPRLALTMQGINIPKGNHACHSCGNPSCCNPAHIYSGTPVENNADKRKHGTNKNGENIHCAKLTKEQVLAIRADNRSYSKIANDYGVTTSNVTVIKSRKTWKHI